jgi:lysyl-tRNA synthetase class I
MEELFLNDLPAFFDRCLEYWHTSPSDHHPSCLQSNLIAFELAYRNYLLWHEEDKARRTDVDDGCIAMVKRAIDRYNQERNDLIEKLDEQILEWVEKFSPTTMTEATNSETPGSIVDRISILSLKIYHMAEDAERTNITEEHRKRSLMKLELLRVQRHDLFRALYTLFDDYLAGRKMMKLYRQFKMYNDPTLNPELYRRSNL